MLMKNNFTCEAPGSDQINVDETDEQHKTVHQLMPFKVREILLVSSLYDAFIIEEEGLISEMVIGEYRDLQLSSPPRVTRVRSGKEALARLKQKTYDLVITMSKNIGMDPFTFGKKIKELKIHKKRLHLKSFRFFSLIFNILLFYHSFGSCQASKRTKEDSSSSPYSNLHQENFIRKRKLYNTA